MLVMLHGFSCDVRLWEPLIARLKDSFTIVAFDMRGSGRSDKPEEPYSIETLTGDAASFIEEVCKEAVDVLGFSLGGIVGMDLAGRMPELVKRLVLVSTLPSFSGPFPPSSHTRELFRRTDVSPELLTEVYETIFGSSYKKRVSAGEYIEFRMNNENPQPLNAYLNQLHTLEAADVRKSVPLISAPTLIIAGKEDQVVSPENSSWLGEKIPGSKLTLFEGAGHMIPIEMPDQLAERIKTIKNDSINLFSVFCI